MFESNLFWIMITFLVGLVESAVLVTIFCEFSEAKETTFYSRKLAIIFSIFIMPIVTTIFTIADVNVIVKVVICLSMMCGIYKFNFEVKVLKMVFICVSYYLFMLCGDFFSSMLIVLFSSVKNLSLVMQQGNIRVELMVLEICIILSLLPVIKVLKFKESVTNKEYIYLIIPSIAYMFIILSIIKVMFESNESVSIQVELIFLFISIGLIISSIYTFFIADRNFKFINMLISEKVKTSKEYYNNLNNHNVNISSEFNTNNKMVDLVLVDKKYVCDLKDIALSVDIEFSPCKFMSNSDVAIVFSNLIDNAIDACDTLKRKGKIIRISGKACGDKKNMYAFKVEAVKIFEVVEKQKLIEECDINLNRDTFIENIYISSVKKSLEKYGADLVVKVECSRLVMVVMFMNLNEFKCFKNL